VLLHRKPEMCYRLGCPGRRWPIGNPLAWLGRRAAGTRPAAVDVDITVLGRGLEHCSGVRITVNATGAACPLKIVRQPQVRARHRCVACSAVLAFGLFT
jgi:hypothetical protein